MTKPAILTFTYRYALEFADGHREVFTTRSAVDARRAALTEPTRLLKA